MTDLTPYAGRWVALAGELVAGVGFTADEALHLAQRNRPKEKFRLRFVELTGGEQLPLSPLLEQLRPLFLKESRPVYLVGGAVRDALLNRVSHDLDFVVPNRAIKLAYKVADALSLPAYILDRERDTGRVVIPDTGMTLDFSCYRGPDLTADLRDRDFTINALALPATAETSASLIDPVNGAADLQDRLIRQTHDQALNDDPVRTLRAVRLAQSLSFTLTEDTTESVRQAAPLLSTISVERVRDELIKLVQSAKPHDAFRQLADLGLLAVILPELNALRDVEQSSPHYEPVLAHTFSVIKKLSAVESLIFGDQATHSIMNQVSVLLEPYSSQLQAHLNRHIDGGLNGRILLRLGALFHDVGKLETQTLDDDGRVRFIGHEKQGAEITGRRLRRLALSNQAINHIKKIVGGHMRPLSLASAPQQPSRRAIYRYFRDTKAAGIDITLLSLADHLATYDGLGIEEQWQKLLQVVTVLFQHYFNHFAETVSPPPLLSGEDLMRTLGLKPGPEIGRLLRLIQEGQAAGEIASRAEAMEFARQARH